MGSGGLVATLVLRGSLRSHLRMRVEGAVLGVVSLDDYQSQPSGFEAEQGGHPSFFEAPCGAPQDEGEGACSEWSAVMTANRSRLQSPHP